MRRNIFVEALIDELARTMPRSSAEDLVRMGVFRPDRNFKRQFRCGARCVSTGKPCRARALESGRCKWHGGCSTGPRTAEGRARIAKAQRKRWAMFRKKRG